MFTTEASIYLATKRIVPEVVDVRRPPYGLNVYIKIKNTRAGLAKPVIMAALAERYIQVKYVFVFDEDVDIFDDSRVLWAFATRTQLDRDMIIVRDAPSPPLDPSKPGELGTVAGFDCTMPPPPKPGFHPPFAPVTKVPDAILSSIRLEDYLP
jgi:UbiD family decarboxylase